MGFYNLVKIYRKYRDRYREYRINKILNNDINVAWKKIKRVFQNSTTIIRGPSGYFGDMYPGFEMLLRFIRKYDKQTETLLIDGISNDNPYVVGYCLVGLSLLKSNTLNDLPKDIFKRPEPVRWSIGCMCKTTTLGYFAYLYKLASFKSQ